MPDLADLKQRLLADADTRAEYKALETEFAIARELIGAHAKAGLSQAELAERMDMSQSAIAQHVPAEPTKRVEVSELNDLFTHLPKLHDDAAAFERDIVDAHAALAPDRDPWGD